MLKTLAAALAAALGAAPDAVADLPPITLSELSYSMQSFGLDEGLVGSNVTAIAQTPDGYLWVGSLTGLARFNGTTFQIFDNENTPEIPKRRILQLFCDSAGKLWITTGENNTTAYENGQFTHFPPPGNFKQSPSATLLRDDTGRTFPVPTLPGKTPDIPLANPGARPQHAATPDGRFWRRDASGGIFVIASSGGTAEPITPPDPTPVGDIFTTPDGQLAVTTPRGIFTRSDDSWHLTTPFDPPAAPGTRLHSTVTGNDGLTWMLSSDNGLVVALPNGELRQLDTGSLTTHFTRPKTIFLDDQQNLWVGATNGLFRLRYSPFVTWDRRHGMPSNHVATVNEDAAGNIWFACVGAVGYLAPESDRITTATYKPTYHEYVAASSHSTGTWLTESTGLLRHITPDGHRKVGIPQRPGGGHTQRAGLATTPDNTVWIGTYNGLFHHDANHPSSGVKRFDLPGPLAGSRITSLTVGHRGGLYFSTAGAGTFHLSPDRTLDRVSPATPESSIALTAMAAVPEQGLWGVTHRTRILLYFDADEAHRVDYTTLGLGDDNVSGIVCDRSGGLWFTTLTSGVAFADHAQLLDAVRRGTPPDDGLFTWFNRSDGLASKGTAFTSRGSLLDSAGRLWIATSRGASVAWPEKVKAAQTQAYHAPVIIEHITVDGQRRPVLDRGPKSITIPPLTPSVAFDFAVLDLATPDKPRHRYRLAPADSGTDHPWTETSERTSADFLDLPPGRYTFEVNASDRYGNWTTASDSLALIVQPAWFQQRAFHLAAAALLVGLAWFGYATRMATLRRRQQRNEHFTRQLLTSEENERKRIASELHDSLGQDLLLVKNTSEMALMGIGPDATPEQKFTEISTLASHAIDEVRSVIDNLRPPELDRLGLNAAIETMAQKVTDHAGIDVTTDLAELPDPWPDDNDIAIYRIAQESVNNAIKHAGASTVTLTTTLDRNRVTLTTADDGRGFDPDADSDGIGLRNLHERIALLGGKLHIDSSPETGTSLTFSFPIPKP